jgi:putative phosphoribosyl transferase
VTHAPLSDVKRAQERVSSAWPPFPDRRSAGRLLAKRLEHLAEPPPPLVLGLPRGGVPVAFEVAQALGGELDLMVVRKLGVPWQPELALGAIASGGVRILNPEVVGSLGLSEAEIERVAAEERRELERRERAYRGDRPTPDVGGRTVILVDDGIATGATIRAAIRGLRQRSPARVVVAVPVAPADTVKRLRAEADEVVCLATPAPFLAIGYWYEDFSPTGDDEVRELLKRARSRAATDAEGSTGRSDDPT